MVYYYLLSVFHLSKVLFSDVLQFKGNFVDGQNNSIYRDVAPLITLYSRLDHGAPFPKEFRSRCLLIVNSIIKEAFKTHRR